VFIGMYICDLKFYPYDYNANVQPCPIAEVRQIFQAGEVFFKAVKLINIPYENDKYTL